MTPAEALYEALSKVCEEAKECSPCEIVGVLAALQFATQYQFYAHQLDPQLQLQTQEVEE